MKGGKFKKNLGSLQEQGGRLIRYIAILESANQRLKADAAELKELKGKMKAMFT